MYSLLALCFSSCASIAFGARPQNVLVTHAEDLTRMTPTCDALADKLPDRVDSPRSEEYARGQRSYWAEQQRYDYRPSCRVRPRHAADVVTAVNVLGENNASFAVKSGGHSAYPGASNIDAGVTLDLGDMKGIQFSPDEERVYIEAGASWSDVYLVLEEHGRAVAGAFDGRVGVGGSMLEGGLGWFSNQHGWSCDAVVAYHVVLANGTAAHAKETDNPDLFWALKGGGGNFGVVTAVVMKTFSQGMVLAAEAKVSIDNLRTLFRAVQDYSTDAPNDLATTAFLTSRCAPNEFTTGLTLVNANNHPDDPGMKHFEKVDVEDYHTEAISVGQLAGNWSWWHGEASRKVSATATVANDARFLGDIFERFAGMCAFTKPPGGKAVMNVQPLTVPHLTGHPGNALGLDRAGPPLLLLSLEWSWAAEEDDSAYDRHVEGVSLLMKQMNESGLVDGFVYSGGASKLQKPFASYGEENCLRLQRVRDAYDPTGVFTRLVPGGHKLDCA